MTRILLIVIGVLASADLILFLLLRWQKSRARANKELYEAAKKRNEDLAGQLGKLQAAEIIRSEERKNADKKIADARSGSARERFDAINGGLRDDAG